MTELWKDIEGYENLYQISTLGRVKSIYRYKKILKPNITYNGYERVNLANKKQYKKHFVHILVWTTFVGPIPEGMQVNHINENKKDNRLENLNLMTPKENTNWGTGVKRRCDKNAKPVVQLSLDGDFIKKWRSAEDIMKETGYLKSCICLCCKGKQKTAYGFKWSYAV